MCPNEWAVNEIPQGICFSIPPYQRGYRWTEEEVTTLLDDFADFAKSNEKTYCLQPLVTQTMKEGDILVVDGQQRLTTIAIILHVLKIERLWEIKYTTEGGRLLSELLKDPGKSINDYFRDNACRTVEAWCKKRLDCVEGVKQVLQGEGVKRVVFLRYELAQQEDGHEVFARLNSGKTPLTSTELIRACYMEADNGLDATERADIAKEWDLIESALADQCFWAIWETNVFCAKHTRMDFLFSLVLSVSPATMRQSPLHLYYTFEQKVKGTEALREAWEETLRSWWWMQSCNEDDQIYHRLGWVLCFTDNRPHTLYKEYKEKGCRIDAFKEKLRSIIVNKIKNDSSEAPMVLTYSSPPEVLREVFVLLNLLEAERRHIRFRWDLYHNNSWDIEHIASQTENALEKRAEQEEWLELAKQEMNEDEWKALEKYTSFKAQWDYVWETFERTERSVTDKDGLGNLALLDAGTNRSYKNAIFPAKRRRILQNNRNTYIPPATEAAFSKSYSPKAVQMRYWEKTDAEAYREAMGDMLTAFMKGTNEDA